MFLPATRRELDALGWDRPDVILVTGDAYIDSPHVGVAVVGKWLLHHGIRAAVLAQPAVDRPDDIARLGEPRLFWGVTAGCIDSLVANYTPTLKPRRQDDYTPGGVNVRPDRASIVYTNLIRRCFKNTRPIVLGGLEASLRRIAHYDYWTDDVRRSLLLDAKADWLAYGMAERTVVELARALRDGADPSGIPGLCRVAATAPAGFVALPSYEEAAADPVAFLRMAKALQAFADADAPGLVQRHGDRYLVQNPPPPVLTTEELDAIYDLDFERDVHPLHRAGGPVRALETIRQSITTHRGCFGQCRFCAIAVHQGPRVVFRSVASVVREAERIRARPGFNGILYDVGGPTANMYGATCAQGWACRDKRCTMPRVCANLRQGHAAQIELLRRVREVPGIRKVFVSSGIRHDLVVADREHGRRYVRELVRHHVSGQIKLAPEHAEPEVLALMGKPGPGALEAFKAMFDGACEEAGERYFMTYYLMAAHPGCTEEHMRRLRRFLGETLRHVPEQVQIFTPTPSTLSTAMYHAGTDLEGRPLFVEKDRARKQRQKDILRPAGGRRGGRMRGGTGWRGRPTSRPRGGV